MLRSALLFLAGTALAGHVADYLKAPAGSEAESAAISAIRPWWDADRSAVIYAVRNLAAFPAAKPGRRVLKIPLPKIPGDELAPKENGIAVWVPRGYDPAKRWPALLVVHGHSGFADAEVEALSGFADEHGVILLAPQDELRRGGGGWGYTDYEHVLHMEALRWLDRNYDVDDSRVFVYGGSRGGHAAFDLSCLYPDRFAGAIPVVGSVKLRNFRYLPNLLHVGIYDMQGGKDDAVLVEYLKDAIARLKKLGCDVKYEEDPAAGHYFPVDWKKVWNWMEDRRRPSAPKRVVTVATRDDRSRSFWISLEGLDTARLEHPPPTRLRPGGHPTRDEVKKAIIEHYDDYCGRVEAKVDGNRIDLEVRGAPRVVVWLSDDLVDLDEPVTIRVNGDQRIRKVFSPSLETMLKRVKETGDRDQLYPVRVVVRGAN